MKNTFTILPDKLIIIEILMNDISPNIYSKLKHKEFKDSNFNRNYNLITDISSFNTGINKNTLQNIIEIFKENKGKINRGKSALVVNDKKILKGIDIKVKQNKKLKSEIKIFTNIEDAKKWTSK